MRFFFLRLAFSGDVTDFFSSMFQRMNIGLRAFFVIADSLQRKVRVLVCNSSKENIEPLALKLFSVNGNSV